MSSTNKTNYSYTKSEIDSMGGGASLSDTISQKANDSDVVHKSGDETIRGSKWFTSGSSLYFNYANVDNVRIFADSEGGNIRLTDSDNNYHYEFDTVAKNYLRLYGGNSSNEITSGFCFHSNGDFYPAQGSSQNLGTSSLKWKDVNTALLNGKTPETIEEQGDEYIRYSSGLQICWGTTPAIPLLSDEIKTAPATFPKSFSSVPSVISCSANPHVIAATWEISETGCEVYLKNTATGSSTHYGRYIAFGYWK